MEANNANVFVTVILLGLSLFTALLLEAHMGTLAVVELVLMLIGLIATAAIIFGFWIEEAWPYPLSVIFFAASLANTIWLFTSTQIFLVFAFGILVNVAGLVMCIVNMGQAVNPKELETYSTQAKKKKR